ncbi:MAG: methylmalonyl Co-A mutase-associated GTPase MeaB [Bacteroides sp.]|jgi:LAO/AO transport system kinase|nr:methylmalonyl Co-A mutase-associated GTPase MeaB [Bacteroides sp.]
MAKEKKEKKLQESSALKVNAGIEQPPNINEAAVLAFKARKPRKIAIDDYVQGILGGDRVLLSKAITLIESSLPRDFELAQQIIEKCIPYSGNSLRIGITGVPGVGKSTFIEAFGTFLTAQGNKIAVLAVDPSSEISKGSILGDKTRMEQLAVDENAFVRPSPSAGSLGGVARKTREIIILCEAAGFNIVLIETVGVGQSETTVHSMVDFFLLLMLAGAGDELQGIKRGIIEMCDGMAINKADGDNLNKARSAKVQYENALHLFPPPQTGWTPRVELCSAFYKTGIDKIWEMILEHDALLKSNGSFTRKRAHQKKFSMLETINQALIASFYQNQRVNTLMPNMESALDENQLTSFQAAGNLLKAYFSHTGQEPPPENI